MSRMPNGGRRPVGAGLFAGPLDALDQVQLAGMRCRTCSVVSFSVSTLCPNCGGIDMSRIALNREGRLETFSILRHRPPGGYRGPEPFEPFAIGLVALPEGVAVVSPLRVCIEAISIGMLLRLAPHVLYLDEDGTEVIAFQFAFADEQAQH